MVHVIDISEHLAADKTGEVAIEIFEEIVRVAAEGDERATSLFEWTEAPLAPTHWDGGGVELVGKEIRLRAPKEVSAPTATSRTRMPQKGRGRPATLKRIAVKSLIYHTYLDLSWAEIAERFCTTKESRRSLKPKITQLRGELRKYGVRLVREKTK